MSRSARQCEWPSPFVGSLTLVKVAECHFGILRTLPVAAGGQAPASVCSVFVTGILAACL